MHTRIPRRRCIRRHAPHHFIFSHRVPAGNTMAPLSHFTVASLGALSSSRSRVVTDRVSCRKVISFASQPFMSPFRLHLYCFERPLQKNVSAESQAASFAVLPSNETKILRSQPGWLGSSNFPFHLDLDRLTSSCAAKAGVAP